MPRHQLTTEERRKGAAATNAKPGAKRHKFTRDECAAGAYTVAAMVLFRRAKRHTLTAEDRRKGGLATAAKRRAERAAALPPEPASDPHTPGCAYAGDVNVAGCCEGYPLLKELRNESSSIFLPGDVDAMAKDIAWALLTSPPHIPTTKMGAEVDPFTLSALKRFRLGPLSPLALTRSQRAHVDIMLAGGWVEKTPEAMIRLTAKGEAALNATENE